jgi:hypothetical protein
MLAPQAIFTAAGRVTAIFSAAPTPALFIDGIGFGAAGEVVFDSNGPAGSNFLAALLRSATGAIYATTTLSATDVFLGGLRIALSGALVVVQANPLLVQNGNPLDANGALCIS